MPNKLVLLFRKLWPLLSIVYGLAFYIGREVTIVTQGGTMTLDVASISNFKNSFIILNYKVFGLTVGANVYQVLQITAIGCVAIFLLQMAKIFFRK